MTVRRTKMVLAAAFAASVALTGCGSSSARAGSSGAASSGPIFTIGLYTDLTGPAASGATTAEKGLRAGIWQARQEGYNFKYVVADTQSSPAGALNAAKQLVEQHHVFAIVSISALTVFAAGYLTSKNIPVAGSNADGTEWLTARNMFASTGGQNTSTEITSLWGKYMSMEGVTSLGAVGYSLPSSANAVKNWTQSAESEGIKSGYLNAQFPLGSTNVGPVVLQMKQAGIDGLITALAPSTGLAIVAGLRQEGVDLKADLLSSGYGADLAQGGSSAQQISQGATFYLPFEPVELQTPATKQFVTALRAVGVDGDPSFSEYNAYLSVDLLVQGLKAAGSHPTPAGLINAMNGIHEYSGAGLFGGHTLDLGNRPNAESGVDHCEWFVKLSGSNYDLIPGAEPLCGTVTGRTLKGS